MSLTRSGRHPVLRTPYVGTLAGAMTEHSLSAAFLLSWLAAASARRNDLPPYPADVVHKPDPHVLGSLLFVLLATASDCLTPVNLPFYKSLRMYEFETSEDKREPRVMSLIYGYSRFVASIFVPARIPRVLLSEKFIENPRPYLVENVLSVFVDFPALTSLVVACVVLAVVVPVRGFWTVCCRHPDVAQGDDEEWERVACTAGLVCCCILMLIFASFTIVALVHVPMGVNNIVPQSHRIIRDIMLFFDKTKHEIDALLVRDYDTFEADFDRRIDSCVVKIGEDFKGIVGESPIEEVQKSVRPVHGVMESLRADVALIDECLKNATALGVELDALVESSSSSSGWASTRALRMPWPSARPRRRPPPYCMELNKTFDLVPSQAASPHQVAQLPLTTEGVQHTFSTDAKDIKLEVEYFGSDLEDLVDQFTASWVRHPGPPELDGAPKLRSLRQHPPALGARQQPDRCAAGRCSLPHRHLLLDRRGPCSTGPAIRFGMKVARDWEIVNGSREALSHVSVDVVQDVFKRFVKCHDQPLSLYKLLGDQLMRNITSSLAVASGDYFVCPGVPGGTDWAFSWLWSGADDPLLSEKLVHFIDPKVPLIPKHINMLTDIETKMNDVRAVKFGDMNMLAYLRDVSSLDFSTDAFVPLSTKLSDIQGDCARQVFVHPHVKDTLKQKVSDILEQVKVTVDAYAKGGTVKGSSRFVHFLFKYRAVRIVRYGNSVYAGLQPRHRRRSGVSHHGSQACAGYACSGDRAATSGR
ncbi:hypothetical protein MRX96_022539 [Rhipicephalus microplus]